jgi:hypothetical protein
MGVGIQVIECGQIVIYGIITYRKWKVLNYWNSSNEATNTKYDQNSKNNMYIQK